MKKKFKDSFFKKILIEKPIEKHWHRKLNLLIGIQESTSEAMQLATFTEVEEPGADKNYSQITDGYRAPQKALFSNLFGKKSQMEKTDLEPKVTG